MDVIFQTLDEKGISQRWLAKRLGIHESLLSKYKSGERPAPRDVVERAARELDLPESVISHLVSVFPSGTDTTPIGQAA